MIPRKNVGHGVLKIISEEEKKLKATQKAIQLWLNDSDQ